MTADEIQMLAAMIAENIAYTTKNVLSVGEAATYLHISKSCLYKLMSKRQIPFSKPCGKIAFFNKSDLEDWMMSNRVLSDEELESKAQSYCMTSRTRKGGVRL